MRSATRRRFLDDWTRTETRKVILEPGWLPAVFRCCVHLLPVTGIGLMVTINLHGYFIGMYYFGLASPLVQSLTTLLLVLVAQLMQSLIMSSVSVMLVDLLRRELLHGREGLPLGLFTLLSGFSSAQYLFSRQFWSGTRAFRQVYKRMAIRIGVAMAACLSMLAVIIAYSLLVPAWDYRWASGAANFTLMGEETTIFPPELNGSHIADAACQNPTIERMRLQLYNDSACIWSGFNSIEQAVRAGYQNFGTEPVLMRDSRIKRQTAINRKYKYIDMGIANISSPARFAMPHLASALAVDAVGRTFHTALKEAPSTLGQFSSRASWKHRDPGGTEFITEGRIPVVRTSCLPYEIDGTTTNQPLVPCTLNNTKTQCPSTLITTSGDSTQALWISSENFDLNENHTTMGHAYLNIQLPKNTEANASLLCIVEASRAQGVIYSSTHNQTNEILFHEAYLDPYAGREPIMLTLEWLKNLTPPLASSGNNYTSLSVLLDDALLYQVDTTIDVPQLLSPLEAVIAVQVLDGISRVGLRENLPQQPNSVRSALEKLTQEAKGKTLDALLDGKLVVPLAAPNNGSTALRTEITMTGLSYRMYGLSSWLAVLFFVPYTIAAITHTVWCLVVRKTCSTYETVPELLLLFLASKEDSDLFANTSAGISSVNTFKRCAKLRVVSPAKVAKAEAPLVGDSQENAISSSISLSNFSTLSSDFSGEEVQVLFRGKHDAMLDIDEHSMISPDVEYGRYEDDEVED